MINPREAAKIILSLGLAGFFLYSAFEHVDLSRVWEIVRQSDAIWLLGAVGLVLLASYPRAYRWRILMRSVLPGLPIHKLVAAILIGYAGNNLIPRAGEIAKIWAIERDPNKMSGLVATVAVERLIDLIMLLAMFAGVMFLVRERLEAVFPWMEGIVIWAALGIGIATLALFVLSIGGQRILDRLQSLFSSVIAARIIDLARSFLDGMDSIRSPSRAIWIAWWTLVLNVAYVGSLYVPLYAFDFPAKYDLGVTEAIVVVTIATLGIVIPTPGGAGTYHLFCSRALNEIYGVPLDEALAFATVCHSLAYVGFLVFGGPGLISLVWGRRPQEAA